MKVGIIGSGDVAKALAAGFLKHGHSVRLGTSNSAKLTEFLKTNPAATAGTMAEAAAFAEVAVLAVKGSAAEQAIAAAGPDNLRGKAVIDVTNPLADLPPENGVIRYSTDLANSGMERLQKAFPDLKFVKAFNSVGNPVMVDPQFAGGKPTMFICGNDAAAKATVAVILDQFGWEVEDMGGVEAARAIEPLCMLWCIPGFLRNDWFHALKVLH